MTGVTLGQLFAAVLTAVPTATTVIHAAPRNLPPLPGAVGAFSHVAVMPLSSLGSTDEAVRVVERILLGELSKLLGDRLIAPTELERRAALPAGTFEGCEGVVDCLLEVVGGLGWDALIVGNIAGLGEGRVINLKMFDPRTGEVLTRASEPASGEERQLIAQMRKAAVSVLAPELLVGSLDLVCEQRGVQILLDGQLIGTTPLAKPRITIAAGKHSLEATGDGLVPFSTFVEVAYEQNATVTIVLPENTVFVGGAAPFYSRWWTWTIFGGAVVGAGLGTLFKVLEIGNVRQWENLYANGGLTGQESKDLQARADDNYVLSLGFYAGGSVLGAIVATLLLLDLTD